MPKAIHFEPDYLAGATVRKKLVVPVLTTDPATPGDGWLWVNSTANVLRYRQNGVTVDLDANLDVDGVQDIVEDMLTAGNNIDIVRTGDAISIAVENLTSADLSDFNTAVRGLISIEDTATLDLTYNTSTGVVTGAVLDSPTVGGRNPAYLLSVDNHTDGTTNKLFTATLRTKLVGIEDGATKNATDAALRDRATHTGEQPVSSITGFSSEVQTVVGGMTIDADTLNSRTAEQLQSDITAAIVDTAPGTLDTLNELAAALGDDPNFATTVSTSLAARSRFFSADVPPVAGLDGQGNADAVITHNLATRDVQVSVYQNSGSYTEVEFLVLRTSVNTVTIRSEGETIPAGYRVNITTAA